MHETPLRGKRDVVQRYGESNRELQAALESEGAEVIEIVTYRWGLPEDTTPELQLRRDRKAFLLLLLAPAPWRNARVDHRVGAGGSNRGCGSSDGTRFPPPPHAVND